MISTRDFSGNNSTYFSVNSSVFFSVNEIVQIFITIMLCILIFSIRAKFSKMIKYFTSKYISKQFKAITNYISLAFYLSIWGFLFSLVISKFSFKVQLAEFINFVKEINTTFIVAKILKLLGYLSSNLFAIIGNSQFWIVVILFLIVLFLYIFVSKLDQNSSYFNNFLKKNVFNIWMAVYKKIKPKIDEIRNSFESVNSKISTLLPIYLLFATLFLIQILSIRFIILNFKVYEFYVLPFMFIIDWSFNFSVFTISSVSAFIDKKNMGDKEKITFVKFLGFANENCFRGLVYTIFKFIYNLSKFLKLFSFLKILCPYQEKILWFYNKAKSIFFIMFKINEFYCEESIIAEVLHDNLGDKKKSRHITEKIFGQFDVFIIIITGIKNVMIRYSVHLAILGSILLKNENAENLKNDLHMVLNGSAYLFSFLFRNITFSAILTLFVYLLLTYYMTSVESAYIINKKQIIEAQMGNDTSSDTKN